ncbi:hypothetical protein ABFT23_22310 [Nocardioides sp. C4-1]|uniref:hypothetical protein n=1 Tax=Nocardioides sp. C4-1 TaxID=3151851 RepID=UPI003265165C
MRKMLSGLAVATALSLAPFSAATAVAAPTSAPTSAVVDVTPVASTTTATAKAKPGRRIALKDLKGRDARIRMTVKPEFGRKYLQIQRFKKGKFRKIGAVRTNAKGVAVRVFEGSRRGIRYRVIAPGGTKYATSGVAFTITTRYI